MLCGLSVRPLSVNTYFVCPVAVLTLVCWGGGSGVATHTDGGAQPENVHFILQTILYLPYTSFSQNAQFIQGIVC